LELRKVETYFENDKPIDEVFDYLKKHKVYQNDVWMETGSNRYTKVRVFKLEKLTDDELKASPKFYCI